MLRQQHQENLYGGEKWKKHFLQPQHLAWDCSLLQQQMQQLQQQTQSLEQGIMDMNILNLALDELVGAEGKEIQAPVGRGIFVKAKLLSETLTVDVGGKNFVEKSIPDTKKIIVEQTGKLKEIRTNIDGEIERLNNELVGMMNEAQAEQDKK